MAINTTVLIKTIWEQGKAKCPLCENGYFIANPAIPAEMQNRFQCTNCKELLILNRKLC